MTEFACSVQVVDVQPQAEGALAHIELVQPSVGIDMTPEGVIPIHIGGGAGDVIKAGAILRLTISDENVQP